MILFEEKVKENKDAFLLKLQAVAASLGIPPDWIMVVINSETGGTFDPQIVNKQLKSEAGYDGDGILVKPAGTPDDSNPYARAQYRATGLIQFMPKTAKQLGTSTQELYNMNNVAQLDYVHKYFLPIKGKIKSFEDLYLYTFYPYSVGKSDDYIFGIEKGLNYAAAIARQNPFDYDKKGHVTVADFKRFIHSKLTPDMLDYLKKNLSQQSGSTKGASSAESSSSPSPQ